MQELTEGPILLLAEERVAQTLVAALEEEAKMFMQAMWVAQAMAVLAL